MFLEMSLAYFSWIELKFLLRALKFRRTKFYFKSTNFLNDLLHRLIKNAVFHPFCTPQTEISRRKIFARERFFHPEICVLSGLVIGTNISMGIFELAEVWRGMFTLVP